MLHFSYKDYLLVILTESIQYLHKCSVKYKIAHLDTVSVTCSQLDKEDTNEKLVLP